MVIRGLMFGWSDVWYFCGSVFLVGWCWWCSDVLVYWLLCGGVMFLCFGRLVLAAVFDWHWSCLIWIYRKKMCPLC